MAFAPYSQNSEVCRACLDRRRETTHVISLDVVESHTEEFTIRYKLSKCMPELDLSLTPNAAICSNCLSAINFMLDFKKICLQAEEDIQNHVREIGSFHVELIDLIHKNRQVRQDLEEIVIKGEPFNDSSCDYTSDLNKTEQEEENSEMVEPKNEEEVAEIEPMLNVQSLLSHPDNTTDYNREDGIFISNTCGEETASKAELSMQLKKQPKELVTTHTSDKHRKSMLNKHMPKHTKEPRFKCQICGYEVSRKSLLVIHTRMHTGEKPYQCTECPYKSAKAYNLKLHARIHTGETPHKCKKCDYKTAYKSNLDVHMHTHTGVKPHKCPECAYECVQASTLKRHMLIHTGETPYKCSVCDYKCAQNSHLVRHMQIHVGEKRCKNTRNRGDKKCDPSHT